MWKEILNPYELAVEELQVNGEGIPSGWYIFSHRTGAWKSQVNIKYSWQGAEAGDRYRPDRGKDT